MGIYIKNISFSYRIVLHVFSIVFLFSINLSAQEYISDFALYDPSYEDDGVWEEEIIALKAMFHTYGFSYHTISNTDINTGVLISENNLNYKAIIAPGGWAFYRDVAISFNGENNIRNFIAAGGNYVGFCAGAYWASDTISWAQSTEGENNYYVESDYTKYNYNLNLFGGIAKGPFGWTPWENGDTASLEKVNINLNNPTMSLINLPDTTHFFYYGGPYFSKIPNSLVNYEVWARAVAPKSDSINTLGGDEPTIIRFSYGEGTVILFSYHPEILINSEIDNLTITQYFNENDYSWDIGKLTIDDINLHSWNIVHAALQIANNKSVSAISFLPKILSLRLFLEGIYHEGTDQMLLGLNSLIPSLSPFKEDPREIVEIPDNAVDWILLELKNSANNESVFYKSVLLKSNGWIINDEGLNERVLLNVPDGEYNLIVRHRNHISIMTKDKIHFNK